jgi:DNA-binding NarL/FixJ family response regulator
MGVHEGTQGLRILIADVQKHARQSLGALLGVTHPDAEILEAATGSEAVALAAEKRPALVILDVRMADLDGIEAARRIRSLWPETRIVILTADSACCREALAAGVDAFLAKWEPPEQLMAALSSLL